MTILRRIFDHSGGSGLDDLTFTPIPEPAGLAALGFVAAVLLPRRRAGRRNRPIQ
jgi:hypothetical protein